MKKLILLFCLVMGTGVSVAAQTQEPRHIRTTFNQPLGSEWTYIQESDTIHYRYINGRLRLIAGLSSLTENQSPTFVGRPQERAAFAVETRFDFDESLAGDEAGLTVYRTNDVHADLCLAQGKNGMSVALKLTLKNVNVVIKSASIRNSVCNLRVRSDGRMYYFDYSLDGTKFTTLDKIDCALLKSEFVGGNAVILLGMYAALNRGHVGNGYSYADFDYFDYLEE